MTSLRTFLIRFAGIAAFSLGLAPLAYAQSSGDGTFDTSNLGSFLLSIIDFINAVVVPLIFALAFIIFIWGMFQYFVAGGANEEKRDQGKQLAMWGLIGFFLMFSLWGIVNLVNNTFNFDSQTRPDLPTFQSGTSGGSGSTTILPTTNGNGTTQ